MYFSLFQILNHGLSIISERILLYICRSTKAMKHSKYREWMKNTLHTGPINLPYFQILRILRLWTKQEPGIQLFFHLVKLCLGLWILSSGVTGSMLDSKIFKTISLQISKSLGEIVCWIIFIIYWKLFHPRISNWSSKYFDALGTNYQRVFWNT